MKANEAPEKIYLVKDRDTNKPMDYWYSATTDDSRIEYTRTDVFIDKACEFLDGCIPDYIDLKHTNVDTFMDVDNERFIENFKNYMKGE